MRKSLAPQNIVIDLQSNLLSSKIKVQKQRVFLQIYSLC